MCKEIKAFIFVGQNVTDDIELNDQNVYQYEFINLGNVPVILNNTIYLKGSTDSFMAEWKETINENEKTQTIYRVRFLPSANKIKQLLVIQKIPAKPR